MNIKIFSSSHNKETAVDSEQSNVENCQFRNGKLDRMIDGESGNEEVQKMYPTKHYYSYENINIDMGGKVAGVGKVRNAYKIFVGKPEGKRPFMKCKYRSDDIIKVRLRV
jgi:hypothetical protein